MEREQNRFRGRNIKVRATEYEYMLIQERLKASGLNSLNQYMLKSAIDGYIINVDYSDFKQLIYEINKIGTNINQIAHKINSENQIFKPEIDELQDELALMWKLIRAKLHQIP